MRSQSSPETPRRASGLAATRCSLSGSRDQSPRSGGSAARSAGSGRAAGGRPPLRPPGGINQCTPGGLCLEPCPPSRTTRLETESPRGRLHLMSAIASARIDPRESDAAVLHLDRCLACRACEAVCPSGVPYGELIEEARADIARARGTPALGKLALWSVSRPRVLGALAGLLALADRTGLRAVARRILPPRLRRLDALAPPLGRPPYRPVAVGALR